MEFLSTIVNLWNVFMVTGLISLVLVFIFTFVTVLSLENNKWFSSTVWGIFTVICNGVCRITLFVGIFLGVIKLIMNFIL